MKKSKFLTTILATAIAITFYSCKGDTGPAGLAGANGAAHINVTICTVTTAWTAIAGGYEVSFIVPEITDATNDMVVVYSEFANNDYVPLPQNNVLVSGDNLTFTYTVGSILFDYQGSGNPSGGIFKVVVVPPAAMNLHPNTNWHDYSQVNAIIEMQNAIKN